LLVVAALHRSRVVIAGGDCITQVVVTLYRWGVVITGGGCIAQVQGGCHCWWWLHCTGGVVITGGGRIVAGGGGGLSKGSGGGQQWWKMKMSEDEGLEEIFSVCVHVFVYILNYQYFLIVLVFTRKCDYISHMDLEKFDVHLPCATSHLLIKTIEVSPRHISSSSEQLRNKYLVCI